MDAYSSLIVRAATKQKLNDVLRRVLNGETVAGDAYPVAPAGLRFKTLDFLFIELSVQRWRDRMRIRIALCTRVENKHAGFLLLSTARRFDYTTNDRPITKIAQNAAARFWAKARQE